MPVTDARTLPDGSEISADIVIIGGGMAGLAIAHEFAGSTLRVLILEGGDLNPDRQIQALYEGECVMSGPDAPDQVIDDYLVQSRVRALGGSGHVWGGKVGPLDEVDFAERAWVPGSGWPFGRSELKAFYDRACDRLAVPRFPVDAGLPEGDPGEILTASGAPRSLPRVYSPVSGRADPAVFDAFRTAPSESPDIAVYLNLNVTALRLGPGGEVDHLETRCIGGARHIARGRVYILATGGIENARLLLASNHERPEGVGNSKGHVGRYFQGHATIAVENDGPLAGSGVCFTGLADLSVYDNRPRDRAHCVFGLVPEKQQASRVANASLTLSLQRAGEPPAGSAAAAACQVARSIDGTSPLPSHIGAYIMTEHFPNPDSRVSLSDSQDALGQPRARLEWRYSPSDWASLSSTAAGLAEALGASGAGRFCWPWKAGDLPPSGSLSRHHMGTTRMSVDPAQGVVDADCRVHDCPNLYIAGSSVFPTSGLVNPTLTLTALAIRLADHLKTKMGIA